MTTHTFKQANLPKYVALIVVVLAVTVAGPFLVFGQRAILDFLNHFPSAKMLGIFIGIVILVPIFLLKRFVGDTYEIAFLNDQVQISKNRSVVAEAPLGQITRFYFSDVMPKSLYIYRSDGSVFFHIRPNSPNRNKQREEIDAILQLFKDRLVLHEKPEPGKKGRISHTSIRYTVIPK